MFKKNNMKRLLPVLMILSFLLVGCRLEEADKPDGINIVATTTMLTDLVETIGGEHVNVTGLMGPGIDPHGYQASASDVNAMYEADIVAYKWDGS